jgi:hypothetical protein
MTDPNLLAWRSAHTALGGRLVDLESLPNVALARTGVLTGTTAALWADADRDIAHAWETYRVLDEVLDAAEADPAQAAALMAEAQVPGTGGAPADPSTALTAASHGVDAAVAVADRLATAWDGLAPRVGAARTAAAASGDDTTERAAVALAELVATDPFAVTEADVVTIEQRVQASGSRRAAGAAAGARLDVDLVAAGEQLRDLTADVDGAADELAHAASRIVGIDAAVPVPDIAALADWLDRIRAAAVAPQADRTRVAADLAGWRAAAEARRAEVDAALAPARTGMRRREEGQGLWTALRAKAGARRLDERPAVVEALEAAEGLLWQAPCDLDAADAALARLSAVLTDPSSTTDTPVPPSKEDR